MKIYKFNLSVKAAIWSFIHLAVMCGAGYAIYIRYDGSVFFAWFALCVVATLLLMMLSIPRRIELSDRSLTIQCLLDVTRLDYSRIASVRCVPSRKIRWVVPIFAGCGFFGYYGLYFDYKHMRLFKIYAGEWRNIVEIVDTDDEYYYVSCRQGESLVESLTSHLANRPN